MEVNFVWPGSEENFVLKQNDVNDANDGACTSMSIVESSLIFQTNTCDSLKKPLCMRTTEVSINDIVNLPRRKKTFINSMKKKTKRWQKRNKWRPITGYTKRGKKKRVKRQLEPSGTPVDMCAVGAPLIAILTPIITPIVTPIVASITGGASSAASAASSTSLSTGSNVGLRSPGRVAHRIYFHTFDWLIPRQYS